MGISKQILQKIEEYFSQKPEVAAVYLYGSQARGDAKDNSDIDLGILLTVKDVSKRFKLQVAYSFELPKVTNKEIEVQDLENCSVDFAHRVLAEGKLLVSNNEKVRIEFEERIFRTYFDLKPALDEYFSKLSEIAKRGELHVRYT